MAVPKKKRPRPATRTRRATWTTTWAQLETAKDNHGHDVVIPRRLRKAVQLGLYEPKNVFKG